MSLWSWVLSGTGLVTMYFAGKKVWWSWVIGLAAEVLWQTYSITTKQYGFIVGGLAYTWVYAKNAWQWKRDGAP